MAEVEHSHPNRLVIVSCPYEGHLNPTLQFASILRSKGFSITIVHTEFNSPNCSDHPDFSFLKIPDGLSDSEIVSGDFMTVLSSLNRNCEVPLRELIEQEYRHKEIACIIYDSLMFFAETVAKHFRLPSIILRTSSALNLLTYNAASRLKKDGLIPIPEYLSTDTIPDLQPLRYRDLSVWNFPDTERLLELLSEASQIRSSLGIIWNSVDCLEKSWLVQLQQQYQVPFFTLGPLYKASAPIYSSLHKEDRSCILWLDKQRCNSVIYVSLGSIACMNEKDLVEMSWGLANSNQPFLWVIRPNLVRGAKQNELLPEGFKEAVGERGCIVKWAPQKEVLAHRAVGGFWSHCGWNSTLESISEGVPMICRPAFGDQRVNARCLSHVWKVALAYENEIKQDEVAKIIQTLMVEQEGIAMRQRALDFSNKINLSWQLGGSSYNSLNELIESILSSKPPK